MNKNTLTSFHIRCSSVKILLWSFIPSSTRKGEAGMHKEGKGIVRGKSYYRIIVVRVGLYFLDKKGIILVYDGVRAQCRDGRAGSAISNIF